VKKRILTLSPTIFDAHNTASRHSHLLFSVSSTDNSTLNFEGFENSIFKNNLSYLDASLIQLLPEIAQILHGEKSVLSNEALCQQLIKKNILEIDKLAHSHIYQYKLKRFLKAVLQGLDAMTVWQPEAHDAQQFSLVKTVGGVDFLFHSTEFLEHLFTHTQIIVESSETVEVQHLANVSYRLKLNLKIRFFH
jgi:translation elongation factor EF-4